MVSTRADQCPKRGLQLAAIGLAVLVCSLAGLLASCVTVPEQVISLRIEPGNAVVFVDRNELEHVPSELSLAADRPHVLFFRAEGYQPEQIVIESREHNGQHMLEPRVVTVRLRPLVPTERGIAIEGAD